MSESKKLCVVIPVHKPGVTHHEKISLTACKNLLQQYDCYLIHPVGMNTDCYTIIYEKLILQPVASSWLTSVQKYNKMKRNVAFYNLFSGYQFMLTYELDSYIFSADWHKANAFNYDYIGAPWFSGFHLANQDSQMTGVGNSGFSLRNIQTCIFVLEKVQKAARFWKFFTVTRLRKFLNFSGFMHLFDPAFKSGIKNDFFSIIDTAYHINEDNYWCEIIPAVFNFKIASVEDAIAFSFEMNPSLLFEKNACQLPIGCHAWEKYEPQFWKDYIQEI